MKNQEYIKLRGKGFKRGSFLSLSSIRASLWLGQDHILCIYNKGYEENYKRFYFRDIQAIIIHQDNHRLVWNITFSVFTLAFAFWGLPLLMVSAFFLALILINWLRGPTCTCYLQTAVSRENLPSLNRLKNVNHTITRLTHVIEREQGHVSPEEIHHHLGEKAQNSSDGDLQKTAEANTQKSKSAAETGMRQPVTSYSGIIHTSLFYCLIVSGILTSIDFLHKSVPFTTIQMILSSGLSILLIVALVKQQGSGLSQWTRRLTWTTLGFMCAVSFIIYIIVIVITLQSKTAIYTTWDYLRMLSSVSPYDNSFLMVIYVVSISYCLTAGIAGLAFMSGYKNK
jgi:hypothetical protein